MNIASKINSPAVAIQTLPVTVLLIDSDRKGRTALCARLDSRPDIHVVAHTGLGKEAVQLCKKISPDVVLLDLVLPDVTGTELIRDLASLSMPSKIIVLTANAEREQVLASLAAGAYAYCLKKNSVRQLRDIIELVSKGGLWLDPAIAKFAVDEFAKTPVSDISGIEDFEGPLSEQERLILALLVDGYSNQQIAASIFVSVHTVKAKVTAILRKLSVTDRVQAAVKAVRTGIV